jgi:carboxyl-terminal processing protease
MILSRSLWVVLAALVLPVPACSTLDGEISPETQRYVAAFNKMVKSETSQSERNDQLGLFRSAMRRVEVYYVTPTTEKTLIDEAIKGVEGLKAEAGSQAPDRLVEAGLNGMLQSLDPHSLFLTPEQAKDMTSNTKGEFGGLGIEITQEDGLTKVIAPMDGTPAQQAGVLAGDYITHVEGEAIKGWAISQVVRRLRGPPDSQVHITLKRGDNDNLQVTITRAVIAIRPVRWRIEGDIGYIRVTNFNERTDSALKEAVDDIKTKIGKRPAGYVLDLRNNAGGLLDQAVKVSDAFLESGDVVKIKGRRSNQELYTAKSGDLTNGAPIIVLTNAGTASASEIVAGALQDHKRGLVIGTRSFGKGSVQTIMGLEGGSAMKLTTALYYTPNGRSIQATGIEPDIIIEEPEKPAAEKPKTESEGKDPRKSIRHESDYSNAIRNDSAKQSRPSTAPKVTIEKCPVPAGDEKDKLLGCGLALLKAGSANNFLALVK